jgi:surface protein
MVETYSNKNTFAKLLDVRSKLVVKKIFSNISKMKTLYIIKYNKKLQNILNKGIDDYMEESLKIEIEIIPKEDFYVKLRNKFIDTHDKKYKSYFHIYFNNSKEETKRNYIDYNEKVKYIKVIIERKVKSLKSLFSYCFIVEKIKFIKYNRKDITDMSNMFYWCRNLKELDVSKLNTDNVINMSHMFFECSSIKELDLSNFNTDKVTNMSNMFSECSLLRVLNLSNFNTDNNAYINDIFQGCPNLKNLHCSDTCIIAHYLKNINFY